MNMSEENGRATDMTGENSKDEMSGQCQAAKTGETAAAACAAAAATVAAASIALASEPKTSKKRKKNIVVKASNPSVKRTRRSPRLIQKEIDKKIWETIFSIQNNERLIEAAQKRFIKADADIEKSRRDNNSNFDRGRAQIDRIEAQINRIEQILERVPGGVPQGLIQDVHSTRREVDDILQSTKRVAERIDEQKRITAKLWKEFFDDASLMNQQTIVELASLIVGGKVEFGLAGDNLIQQFTALLN
mmetsp:Transcript_61746/g.151075  ORF Transcript_61746/g.151075 Transcript_61746/m.151075 type:complete len:247 (+) Transcript_61746:91-831(+)|eukprot:CAMPEP_0113474680 /NCGR_PEP_ID=MMETSP0014_2-20120614/18716_1 /TAXON_ID=2857 /ORGANISM="Nitzschia sp." /LENGTH=246 /DNA_ID=CAMNT_0000367549 /DNA_START=88 /DNA_END=828 /DNA_ORIENTATION=+ /assembly_acc=CAM_ASM_000159